MQLILSLFPGIDLFGKAFEDEGFCVVRGPELILGQDINDWHIPSGKFDGIIGGPPCQSHSQAIQSAGGSEYAKHKNLIPMRLWGYQRILKYLHSKRTINI